MVVNLYHWREDCPLKGASIGHATPGVIFLCMGVWWAAKFSFRYNNVERERGQQRLETLCYRSRFKKLRFLCRPYVELWEGLVLIITAVIGFIGEQSIPYMKWNMFNSTGDDAVFVHGDEWQHCTMYTFFGIFGVALLLSHTLVTGLRPYEMFFGGLAFFVEGMLFYFHVQGRNSNIDIVTHMMLVIAAFMCSGFSLAEVWMPSDKLLPFLRSGATIVQGTWFCQIAYMLSEQWVDKCAPWEDTMSNVMFVTMAFCWHIVGVVIIIAVIFGMVSLCLRKVIMKRVRARISRGSDEEEWDNDIITTASDEESAVKLLQLPGDL